MAGRGRPAHALPVQGSPPSLLGRPPPPAAIHPADEPLLVRRAPVPSSILALEDRLAAQHRQIQVLLVDNQQLAASHVALKRDLSASKHELRLAAASAAETKASKDAEVREVYERSLKAEAEVRALEGMRAELAQVRSDVQSLGAVRHELVEQLQGLQGQLSSARAEHKQADTVMAEIEIMRKEIQKGRAAIEFEKKVHADNIEQSQIMENNMVLMAREIEKLHAELANAEKRAQVAAAASANSGSGYAGTYGNPGIAYAVNFAGPHNFHQVQRTADNDPQFGLSAVPHGQYDIQQTYAHR
ncbi:hypothetical protein MUK42_31441 [Musa troglodytarum]|uniref:Protein FLC EXPRESSOR n=1 Tax=Musa troglodytarum TaxID=320322 RepID=A0A9E7L6T7_9LILI|nr:hypothetical protein MUK42_31441 [Musa troglodytarum]